MHTVPQEPAKMHAGFHGFVRLAAVECALILQQLDNKSRLAAAACSRRMLSDALQPLCWKYAQLVTIKAAQLPTVEQVVRPFSLLQLAPLQVNYAETDDLCAERLGQIPRLFCVNVSKVTRTDDLFSGGVLKVTRTDDLLKLLQSAPLQHVKQIISSNSDMLSSCAAAVMALPALTSCSLSVILDDAPSMTRPFPLEGVASQLTELALFNWCLPNNRWWMTSLAQSRAPLRRLHLINVVWSEFSLATLFSAPALHQLHFLSLDAGVSTIPATHFHSALQFLPQLRVLQLGQIFPNTDELLAQLSLSCAPMLQLLRLLFEYKQCLTNSLLTLPSIAAVRSVLTALSQMHIEMVCSPDVADASVVVSNQLRQLLLDAQQQPQRFRVHVHFQRLTKEPQLATPNNMIV